MYFGTMPNGVNSPCGEVTSTTDPTVAPISSAMSLPRMIGGIAATRCCTPVKSSGDSVCVERAPRPLPLHLHLFLNLFYRTRRQRPQAFPPAPPPIPKSPSSADIGRAHV